MIIFRDFDENISRQLKQVMYIDKVKYKIIIILRMFRNIIRVLQVNFFILRFVEDMFVNVIVSKFKLVNFKGLIYFMDNECIENCRMKVGLYCLMFLIIGENFYIWKSDQFE